jgi:Na+-translocating ferredoxin:NAD+ oxidoreductase RnfD subunit
MPPEVVAPDPVSVAPAFISKVVVVGTAVTINFLSANVEAEKLEFVIALKVDAAPNKIISPTEKLCAEGKVKVTVD